jgi:hypothetical protein
MWRTEPSRQPVPTTAAPEGAEPVEGAVASCVPAVDCAEVAGKGALDSSVLTTNARAAQEAALGSSAPTAASPDGAGTAAQEPVLASCVPTAAGPDGANTATQELVLESCVPAADGSAGASKAAQAAPLTDGAMLPPPPDNCWMDTQEDRDKQRQLAALGLPWLPEFEEQLLAHAKALCSRVCSKHSGDAG